MTGREMIVALLAYDLDTPLWVGKGIGPVDGIELLADSEDAPLLIIRPVTP